MRRLASCIFSAMLAAQADHLDLGFSGALGARAVPPASSRLFGRCRRDAGAPKKRRDPRGRCGRRDRSRARTAAATPCVMRAPAHHRRGERLSVRGHGGREQVAAAGAARAPSVGFAGHLLPRGGRRDFGVWFTSSSPLVGESTARSAGRGAGPRAVFPIPPPLPARSPLGARRPAAMAPSVRRAGKRRRPETGVVISTVALSVITSTSGVVLLDAGRRRRHVPSDDPRPRRCLRRRREA